jgi:hypothetical protein
MWPERGDALSRTIEAEQAIEDLYAEALRRWAPDLRAQVLPTLTAATLPPDPNGTQQASTNWNQLAEELVIAGTAVLWAATLFEVLDALGLPLPELPVKEAVAVGIAVHVYRQPSRKVLQIIDGAVGDMDRQAVIHAARVVEETPALRETRNAFLDTQRNEAAQIPGQVQAKIEAAIRNVSPATQNVSPDEQLAETRAAVEETVDPAGEQMREIARTAGHQAASVQNHAVLTAAEDTEDAEELDKVWICTIDGKTRETHFAADGQRAPLGGSFTVGGEQMDYPGDRSASIGEWINCRCRMGILAKDEGLPDEVDRHTERLEGRDSTARNREGSQRDEIERRAREGTIRAREDPEGIGRTAAGGWTAPSEEIDMTHVIGGPTAAELNAFSDNSDSESEMFRTFTAVLAIIGEPTSDGRMLAKDIELSFRPFPLPLMWSKQTNIGHLESFTIGVLESASIDGGQVVGTGYLLNSPEADEGATEIAHGVTGPSVDLAATEWMLTDEDGNEVTEEEYWDAPMDAVFYQTITKGELIGTTLVATPAFGTTSITLGAERESRDVAVVASAAEEFRPRVYDHRLFEDPKLTGPTLPTMGEDGRIYGHLACFGACHRSIQQECVMAPRSRTNYGHFHTSPAVHLDNGDRLPVGRLTVETGHAPHTVSAAVAMAHYDNTGACFALVRVGEDKHGIWFSGVAHPTATPEQIEAGITAPLSGDWRDFGQGLELIAALAVNTPGFPARGREDDQGRPIALVASLGPAPATANGGATLTLDDIKAAVREGIAEERRQSALAAEREAALARARDAVGEPPEPKSPNDEIAELLARAGL